MQDVYGVLKLLGLQNGSPEAQCLFAGFSGLRIFFGKPAWENRTTKEEKERIKGVWQEHLKTHRDDFEGCLASLKGFSTRNGEVCLIVRSANFSSFVATRSKCLGKRVTISSHSLDKDYPLPISFGIVTRTLPTEENPNGCIVAAIRGNTAFDSGKATFLPGGYVNLENKKSWLEKRWPLAKVPGMEMEYREIFPEKEIKRKLEEELKEVYWTNPPRLLGIVHSLSGSCNPAIIGRMDVSSTAENIMDFCKDGTVGGIKEIICVPADLNSLREFVQKHALGIHDVYKIAFYLADTM